MQRRRVLQPPVARPEGSQPDFDEGQEGDDAAPAVSIDRDNRTAKVKSYFTNSRNSKEFNCNVRINTPTGEVKICNQLIKCSPDFDHKGAPCRARHLESCHPEIKLPPKRERKCGRRSSTPGPSRTASDAPTTPHQPSSQRTPSSQTFVFLGQKSRLSRRGPSVPRASRSPPKSRLLS